MIVAGVSEADYALPSFSMSKVEELLNSHGPPLPRCTSCTPRVATTDAAAAPASPPGLTCTSSVGMPT